MVLLQITNHIVFRPAPLLGEYIGIDLIAPLGQAKGWRRWFMSMISSEGCILQTVKSFAR